MSDFIKYVTLDIYRALYLESGYQDWWPGDSDFEIAVGAILTQNTAWSNVERAINNLKTSHRLTLEGILSLSLDELATLIRPSGYFNQKAKYLYDFCKFLTSYPIRSLQKMDLDAARSLLLSVRGVGFETADSMLLYAVGLPVFVVDAYTKRIFSRLGFTDPEISYTDLQDFFHKNLDKDLELFRDYHAQVVMLGKDHCKPTPECGGCPLADYCCFSKSL
ncbi:MAG: endonuclease III domain-containing protein [Oligoflexia bacterium]|nr:endonuclease III domain-containing protein [Oligoflexia bacterium]